MPIDGLPWLFVKVETDDGFYGLGECTDYAVNLHLVNGINSLKSMLLGMDASNIENIWQTIFHSYDDFDELSKLENLWSPYKTLACLYLWKYVDSDESFL